MTTLDVAAPAQADTAAPASTPANPAIEAKPDAAVVDGWAAALDEDTRTTAEAKGWSKLSEKDAAVQAAKSYAELQKKTGSALNFPKDDATPEEKAAFMADLHKRLGRPDAPEGIEFKMPEKMPDGVVYDKAFADEAKAVLHEAGIYGDAAQKVHDFWIGLQGKQVAAHAEWATAQQAEASAQLAKAWGSEGSETHTTNLAYVNRALREFDMLGEFKAFGLVGPKGEARAPRLVAAIARLAEQAFAEGKAPDGGSATPHRKLGDGLYPHLPE